MIIPIMYLCRWLNHKIQQFFIGLQYFSTRQIQIVSNPWSQHSMSSVHDIPKNIKVIFQPFCREKKALRSSPTRGNCTNTFVFLPPHWSSLCSICCQLQSAWTLFLNCSFLSPQLQNLVLDFANTDTPHSQFWLCRTSHASWTSSSFACIDSLVSNQSAAHGAGARQLYILLTSPKQDS